MSVATSVVSLRLECAQHGCALNTEIRPESNLWSLFLRFRGSLSDRQLVRDIAVLRTRMAGLRRAQSSRDVGDGRVNAPVYPILPFIYVSFRS